MAAGITAVGALFGLVTGANVLPNLLNVMLFGIIGLGVQREWRSAAVIGTTLLALGLIEALSRGAFPGVITPFVLVGLINGVRGTFATRRLRDANTRNDSGSPESPRHG